MKVLFTKDFNKELAELNDRKLAEIVEETKKNIEKSKSPWGIKSLKKLQGYKTAYRIRSGDYRIGIFILGNEVIFAAIGLRKDIYKKFP